MLFNYSFYTQSFSSIHDVISHMQQLDKALDQTELHNLKAFNTTYLIITQAVLGKFNTKFFDNDNRMEKLDIIFAKYYFDALHNYTQKEDCDPAWAILFDACKRNNLYQWQYMALGVNAHVNNDLPFTLFDAGLGDSYRNDYNKINTILALQLRKVVFSLKDTGLIERLYKSKATAIYFPLLVYIIQHWRNNAWRNYQKLQKKPETKEVIKRHATKIAHYFDTIQKWENKKNV